MLHYIQKLKKKLRQNTIWIQGQKTFISREWRYSREDFGTDIHYLFFIDSEKSVQPVTLRNLKPNKSRTNTLN